MTFEVDVAGRIRTVSIEQMDRAGWFRVVLDGESHVADVTRAGAYGLSVLLQPMPLAGGRAGETSESAAVLFSERGGPEKVTAPVSRDVQITAGACRGEVLVHLNGRVMTATVNGRRTGRAADAGGDGQGEIHITAPMPGRVVRLLVSPGEEIGVRQGVVVVEAMKMENELRAPRAGRVKEVSVAAGTSVEAGRILAIIE